jgi:hypothetical protein
VDGKKVYCGYVDVPLAIATAYADRQAALHAIDRFNIDNQVCGIVAVEKNGRHKANTALPVLMRKHVSSWKKE